MAEKVDIMTKQMVEFILNDATTAIQRETSRRINHPRFRGFFTRFDKESDPSQITIDMESAIAFYKSIDPEWTNVLIAGHGWQFTLKIDYNKFKEYHEGYHGSKSY